MSRYSCSKNTFCILLAMSYTSTIITHASQLGNVSKENKPPSKILGIFFRLKTNLILIFSDTPQIKYLHASNQWDTCLPNPSISSVSSKDKVTRKADSISGVPSFYKYTPKQKTKRITIMNHHHFIMKQRQCFYTM